VSGQEKVSGFFFRLGEAPCVRSAGPTARWTSRDRCSGIDQYNGSAWVDLADYILDSPPGKSPCDSASQRDAAACQGLGHALSKRETTCDYPGGTQP
jgi:hypothetical protein